MSVLVVLTRFRGQFFAKENGLRFAFTHTEGIKLTTSLPCRHIGAFFNPHRRHSSLGYVSPMDLERQHAAIGRVKP